MLRIGLLVVFWSSFALGCVFVSPGAAGEDDSKGPAGVVPWKKPDRQVVNQLSSKQLDELVLKDLRGAEMTPPVEDEEFLRRASLDLIGRQPTVAELEDFRAADPAGRRAAAIDRLLAEDEFGVNWANYWSDVISYRTPQPELTFLDYTPLKVWLAEKLNAGATWDEIAWHLLTASGKVKDNPAATFVGFHQASPTRLTSETTRVFLGVNLACAECHDHKFETWTQQDFHQLAAFFVRAQAKLPHNKSADIVVSSKDKGEHRLPEKNTEMLPTLLAGDTLPGGVSDLERRTALAKWIASDQNEFFARAYVNRIWSRLMGRGFYEPVDHLSENESPYLPHVLAALEDTFTANGFDIKQTFRLIISSEAYRRSLPQSQERYASPFVAAIPQKLRGDEVFQSLATALDLKDERGEQKKTTGSFRFPPPPKSTRDKVNDAFGFDPSVDRQNVTRTMKQAMWMMNDQQLQRQINAAVTDTVLGRLLAEQADDGKAVEQLFQLVLARRATPREVELSLSHVKSVDDRGQAFEDVLWSLINSAEFTSRR